MQRVGNKRDKSTVFSCTHLFRKCRWSPIHSALCVKRGAGRKEGQQEEGSGEMEGQGWKREGAGGLLVISPEGDSGRGAHCNGCHVVPSLHN